MGNDGHQSWGLAVSERANAGIEIVGVQPVDGAHSGIRKWPEAYVPKEFAIFAGLTGSWGDSARSRRHCPPAGREEAYLRVFRREALAAALRLSASLEHATIVSIVSDRGDRYLSTGVFAA